MTGTRDSDTNDVRRDRDDARPAAPAAGPVVVYCGGCDPHIDRGAVASELAASPTFVRPGAAVYLSGCTRACASDHQLVLRPGGGALGTDAAPDAIDDPSVVVAGAHVDGVPTPAHDIAAAVIDKLKE